MLENVRFCVCIYLDGNPDRIESDGNECAAALQELTGMSSEDATSRLIDAVILGSTSQTTPYELYIEHLGWTD
ncbi:hypothetical protein [Rhizobium mongolense]|uniref:Uncharacterized protein n=2 Tax=Rhizobium mongolense TaxID=57676 RepID=A0ABR6IWC2_9HYPH|nr:hypothetical protein [Rhizobium mongolense]MBB4232075.1 hypothetical protein [Rhizobium mongolense]TVZ63948.1 hypothetical protein BCL32_4138 [Rhizobium mongolense USDA 1844]